eukprot:6256072-Pyramimonas_sp.AAC.1
MPLECQEKRRKPRSSNLASFKSPGTNASILREIWCSRSPSSKQLDANTSCLACSRCKHPLAAPDTTPPRGCQTN